MKKQYKIGLSGFIIFVILTACDTFILPPALNLNPNDPNQGFGRLESALIDKGKVRVIWDWYDLERKVRGIDPVYDEVIIKHNRGSYPGSRLGGESFEINDWNPATNPMWSATFSDLKDDREHYFALYAHEKDGRWVGPMYTSTYLEGFEYELIPNIPITYSVAAEIGTGITTDPPVILGTISSTASNLYYYNDIWEEEKIISAMISINITAGPTIADTILIYPMRSYCEDTDSPADVLDNGIVLDLSEFSVDRSIRAEIPLAIGETGTKVVDITSIFSKSHYHRHNGIIMMMEGAGSVDFVNPPIIELEIARNW